MKDSNNTLLVVLTDDSYVRNYATSGAFDALLQSYEIDFVVDSQVSLRSPLEQIGSLVGEYEISEQQKKLHDLHFQLLMWRFRKKSATFFYRWLRNTNWSLTNRGGSLIARVLSIMRWFIAAAINPRGLRIPLLANSLSFPLFSRFVKGKLQPSETLRKHLKSKPYSVIIFPSSAFEPANIDLVRIGKEVGIPTLCLIDNWDNLTSKTIFWEKPDHLGVWGQQALEQARDIHAFGLESVHILGTPRFDNYFAPHNRGKTETRYPFPYILFVGSAMPFDEIGVLKKLDLWLENSAEGLQDFKVVYRPHPWQQKRNVSSGFIEAEFSRTILDRQISDALDVGVEIGARNSSFQPSLTYYPELLKGAACVVGPLTTMLLEASLCLRPTIGLSYFDGHHANTSKRYFSHFDGMERVPGFHFCEDGDFLITQISQALGEKKLRATESRRETDYFVLSSPGRFAERLDSLVQEIVSDKTGSNPHYA